MKSTHEEIAKANELVASTEKQIKTLAAGGRKIHIIWDFDFVLASGLSDDVFSLVKFDLKKYFEYEARLSMSVPKPGIWLPLADKVGKLHTSQDIVTARSSFLAFRVMMFCMWFGGGNPFEWVRWVLYIGHQSKADSFKIILDSLKKDERFVVFFIDDNAKHVEVFQGMSQEIGMGDRTFGVVSPKIRAYTEEQLKLHYDSVMNATGECPTIAPGYPGGVQNGFFVLPDGIKGFRKMCLDNFFGSEREGAINTFDSILKTALKAEFPDLPVTPENLYFVSHFLKEEARHNTMIDEMMFEESHKVRQDVSKINYPFIPRGRTIKYVPINNPYMLLAKYIARAHSLDEVMPGAAVVVGQNGTVLGIGANGSNYHKHHKCRRIIQGRKSGEGYELCEGCHPKNHSGPSAIRAADINGNDTRGADLYLWGHWWCCKPCWDAMEKAGIKDVYLLENSEVLFNREHPDNIVGRQFEDIQAR